jgi:hypothetical protein
MPSKPEQVNARKRERYASDPEYRRKRSEESKRRYAARKEDMRERYRIHASEYRQSIKGTHIHRLIKIRKMAAKRNIPFDLSCTWFLEHIWGKPCHYCDGKTLGGVDRLDNSKGYEPVNCVPCCQWCNTIKLTYTVEEMLDHITTILRKHAPSSCTPFGDFAPKT